MSYLQFKEKIYSLKENEFERHRMMDRAQVYAVAVFWVAFTVFLLWHGHEVERKEKAALRPPVIPEAVSVSQDEISLPTAQLLRRK